MTTIPRAADALVGFQTAHGFFVEIDSGGCAFDAMEIKHQECFTPTTIRCWGMQPVARAARETALFVNLYSTYRGLNRWVALVKLFELLAEREEVRRRGAEVPTGEKLKQFIASGGRSSRERPTIWCGPTSGRPGSRLPAGMRRRGHPTLPGPHTQSRGRGLRRR